MEALGMQNCATCQGTGSTGNKVCSTCQGHQRYFFVDNNLFYWDKQISYAHIFIREFERTVNIIINSILIVCAIFTVWLIYSTLNQVQFDPRALWRTINVASAKNFWLWTLAALDMFLYYRLTIPSLKARAKVKLLKDKNTFIKHNIADSLGSETSTILDKAWLYAQHKGIFPVTTWHLMFILLNDRDIRLVLARLGVGSENLKHKIDENLSHLVQEKGKAEEISVNVQDAILNAYMHMQQRRNKYIAEIDLLYGIVSSSAQVKDFFYEYNIDENKIDNVITWIEINKKLVEKYRSLRSKAILRPKSDVNRAYTAIATPILDSFSQDMTRMAKAGALPVIVGRENEINDLINTIESDESSVVLIGPTGVGKDSIVVGLANRMLAEEVPELFQDKRLVSLSVPMLVSGATGTGVMEERLLSMINEIAVSGNIILHIDNIHQLTGVSSESTEGMDLSEVLAQQIRQHNLIVIGATSNEEYVKYVEGSAIGQALKKVNIGETDKNQTIKIMEAHVGTVEAKHGVYFTYEALERIYDLSDRYMADQNLPKKAIDLMDEAGILVRKAKRADKLVRGEDIAELVSRKTNIPVTAVTAEESSKLLNLEQEIHDRVIGQDEAVKMVSAALRRARSELRDEKRPIVNLLFLGPTGVGKTELAKTVAEKYFGDEENMIRLDMSEYQTQETLPRLLGSAETNTAGLLTEAVRHKPFALLLLDEMEKAHPDILNVFLQVMDDGRLTDALGRTVDFTNLIVVATSNAGTSYIQDRIKEGQEIASFYDHFVKEELRSFFRPEFINRFDGVVVFKPLRPEEIFQITGLMMKKVKKRLETKGVFFEWTAEAQKELAAAGFDPVFGARPLRRLIQERVDNALANFLLQGQIGRRDTVIYDVGGQIKISKAQKY